MGKYFVVVLLVVPAWWLALGWFCFPFIVGGGVICSDPMGITPMTFKVCLIRTGFPLTLYFAQIDDMRVCNFHELGAWFSDLEKKMVGGAKKVQQTMCGF